MAVTINDFEVVPAPEPASEPATGSEGEGPDQEELSLDEFEVLLQREMERLARVRAH